MTINREIEPQSNSWVVICDSCSESLIPGIQVTFTLVDTSEDAEFIATAHDQKKKGRHKISIFGHNLPPLPLPNNVDEPRLNE